MADSALFYEPKGDSYGRVFGSLEKILLETKWDEVTYKKINSETVLLYGFCTHIDPIVKGGRVDGKWKQDESWSYSPQLMKIELHAKTWKNGDRGEQTPSIAEAWIAQWILDMWKEGEVYSGSIEFNSGYKKIFEKINKSIVAGDLDSNTLKMFFDVQRVDSPSKITSVPSLQSGGSGGGKTYKSEFQKVIEKYPNFFKGQEVKSVEDCIDVALKGWKYGNWKPSTGMKRSDEYRNKSLIVFCGLTSTPVPLGMLKDASVWDEEIEEEEELPIDPPDVAQSAPDSPLDGQPIDLSSLDFSGLLAQTNIELKRLGWTQEQGKAYLEKTYGKDSRQKLTDKELLEFVQYLMHEPDPSSDF